ncbi:MAG: hypothetical protein K2M85_03400 [Paramuribaculum sp.]|nr:hypothetical protein [Paramuribaculum sp.]
MKKTTIVFLVCFFMSLPMMATKPIAGWVVQSMGKYFYSEQTSLENVDAFLVIYDDELLIMFISERDDKIITEYRITSLREGNYNRRTGYSFSGDVIDSKNGEVGHINLTIGESVGIDDSIEIIFPGENLFFFTAPVAVNVNYKMLVKVGQSQNPVELLKNYPSVEYF